MLERKCSTTSYITGGITRVQGLALACTLVVGLTACGAVDPEESSPEEVADAQQPVEGGTTWTPTGIWEAIGHIGNCTATLVTEHTVLTAAHCIGDDGETRTFTLPNGRGSVQGTAVVHPLYEDIKWLSHDYAVIVLNQSIYSAPGVNSAGLVPMPVTSKTLAAGDSAIMYGYGGFGEDCANGGDGQARFRQINLTAVTEDWHYQYTNGDAGLCPGDSGGPLVVNDGGWKVAGVNSWTGGGSSHFKAAHLAFDWIRERAAGPGAPGNTWGHCVFYKDFTDSAYLSIQGNLSSFASYPGYDNAISTVWVKKGYKATLHDLASYGGALLTSVDGFTGNRCNEFGCLYKLAGTSADNAASSIKCESALPGDTWGHCVYYDRYGNGGYYSTQGDASSFSGANAFWNNRISQIWVKKGHTAELFSGASYQASPYWSPLLVNGTSGDLCNSYGCLHDLVGTVGEKTASSIKCQ